MQLKNQEHYGYRLIIDPNKWLRGEEACKRPFLYDAETGKIDIMGYIMLLFGYGGSSLKGMRWPSQVVQKLGQREQIIAELKWMVSKAQADTEESVEIMTINDDPKISDDERLRLLALKLNQRNFGLILPIEKVKKTADELKLQELKKVTDQFWGGVGDITYASTPVRATSRVSRYTSSGWTTTPDELSDTF
jgi:hypothetical protein